MLIPDYFYILCVSCHRYIAKIMKDTEEITCGCGQIIKNPYYEVKNEKI